MKTKRKVQKKKCRCDEFGGKNSKMGENDHFFKCPLFMSEQQNKEECVPIDICYTSIPPQAKCKNCGRFWFPSEEKTPICSAQTPPLTMEERLKSEFEKAYWSDDYPDLEDLVNRPDNISNWWLSKISSAVSWALKEQREEMIKNIKNISWEDMKCDCNMCYAHEKAINSVLSLLSNNKE